MILCLHGQSEEWPCCSSEAIAVNVRPFLRFNDRPSLKLFEGRNEIVKNYHKLCVCIDCNVHMHLDAYTYGLFVCIAQCLKCTVFFLFLSLCLSTGTEL